MKYTIVCLLLLAALFPVSGQKKALNNIDSDLNKLLKSAQAPGFAVAIVKGQQVIYAKGFGYRDMESKTPVDANTLFAIGSTSKAFTTALLGQLRGEKKLSFDESPRKYIPELEFYNDDLNDHVNIIDMMSHRTGMPRHDYSWYLFPVLKKDSLLMRVKYHEPFTGIREQWYYNNFMYLAQGVIAEKITGKSWEDNIRERFFAPLKMERSNLDIEAWQTHQNIAKGYSTSYENGKQEKLDYFNIAAMSPAGSINSSVNEMTNWLLTWVNGGKFNGEQLIPADFYQEAINPHIVIGNGIPDPKHPDMHLNGYGYAWFTSSYKGHYRLEHGGNIDGFSANVSFFPSDSIGIVVLSNQDGSIVPKMARNIIADHLLGAEKTDWNKEVRETIAKVVETLASAKQKNDNGRVKNTSPSHSKIDYTGVYNHPGYGDFTIHFKNDSLYASFAVETLYLSHYHFDVFEPFVLKKGVVDTTEGLGLKFNFISSETGDIASVNIKLEPTLDPISFKRTPLKAAVSSDKLKAYVGTYTLSGADIKVSLQDENLHLLVPGQPEYTLLAISPTEFVIQGLDGYKVKFLSDATEMTFVQPNGNFTCKRKN